MDTPAALIDTLKMQRNIQRMQQRANHLGVHAALKRRSVSVPPGWPAIRQTNRYRASSILMISIDTGLLPRLKVPSPTFSKPNAA
ncbi:hypothetical protein QF043_003004 [Pseudomonas sp. W3I7]|nr:hypothetical protein [Pseudomonas sp. W3I7]